MSENYVQELSNALQTDFREMIKQFLEKFLQSENCCMQFPTFHPNIYRNHIHQLANEIGLKTQSHAMLGGIKCVQVYKSNCNSYLDETPVLKITDMSRKIIYRYLSENCLTLNERLDLTPGFSKIATIGVAKPRVQVYRFSMGTVVPNLTPTIPPLSNVTNQLIIKQRQSLLVYKYRNDIIDSITKNQIVIICGESGIGKSTQIPQYILENSTDKRQHCRIIFAHIHQISAINTSRIVANEREEKLGTIIGYQIRLKSVSSNSTNLLYTTTEFFLRCLMGINSKDVFQGVTHVIIDDCHERDFYTDLLLFEIKEILGFYPELKIIFLSCPTEHLTLYEDYFSKNLKILQINSMTTTLNSEIKIKFLDEILMLIQYMTPSMVAYLKGDYEQCVENEQIDLRVQDFMDTIIENYMETGDNKHFEEFIYLVQIENIPIDIKHSTFKITMLMAACKNDKIEHLKKLIKLNANVFAVDTMDKNAIHWAQISQSVNCLEYLNDYNLKHELNFVKNQNLMEKLHYAYINSIKNNPDNVDFKLIISIIKFINKFCDNGTIIIFLPCFEDLIKMEYILLTEQNQIKDKYIIKIFKLHENMQKRELDEIIVSESTNILRKIILCTNIAESCLNINDGIYVIDTGRYFSKCEGSREFSSQLQWISNEKCKRRKLIVCRNNNNNNNIIKKNGILFRLYSNKKMLNFSIILKPEIIEMNLDKICLFVKLLSPYTSVREHFGKTISSPPLNNIEKSIKLLYDIGAFDEEESVTILGTRLIDIPVDIQLGKVLIYSIVLQCLDPVLTIISSLAYKDPLELSNINNNDERKNIIITKQTLADESNSDHLVLLYLFQKWQEDRTKFNELTMNNFLLNSKLQKICEIRSKIVGIVRAAQLIHSQGIFSMNYINLKGDNWSLVKACFVAGMYPNICKIDKKYGIIKTLSIEKLHRPIKTNLHPSSILRNLNPQSLKDLCINYQSDWIIYQELLKSDINNLTSIHSIKSNTLIAPIAIILFAGNIKKSDEDDLININSSINDSINYGKNDNVSFIIDNWIKFILNNTDYYLLFTLRQKFSHIFLELLENCDNQEKMRRNRQNYIKKLTILDTISEILSIEDDNINFRKHNNVGNRPKALPLAFTSDMNLGIPESDFDFNETQSSESLCTMFNLKSKICNNNNFVTPSSSGQCQIDLSTQDNNNLWPVQMNAQLELKALMNSYNPNPNNNKQYVQKPNNVDLPTSFNCQLPKLRAFSESIKQSSRLLNIQQQKTNYNIKFYIFKFITSTEAKNYFNVNKFNTGNQYWDELCLKILQYLNENIIFLFDITENKFCGVGELKAARNKLFEFELNQRITVDVTIEEFKSFLDDENFSEKFQNGFYYELSTEVGVNLFRLMRNKLNINQ